MREEVLIMTSTKRRFSFKRSKLSVLMVCVGLSWGSLAFAQGTDAGDDAILQAIQGLAQEMKALVDGTVKTVTDAVYQVDQNIAGVAQTNQNNAAIKQQVSATADQNTLNQIQAQLAPFGQVTNPPAQQPPNLIANYSIGVLAGDSILPKQGSSFFSTPPDITQNNTYFNFGSLVDPLAYTTTQAQQSAQYYVGYLGQVYQPLIDPSIGLNRLIQISTNKDALMQFEQTPTYQLYQNTVRSFIAQRSVAINNFSQLMAERTVVKGLGQQTGIQVLGSDGKTWTSTPDASPLQVEAYEATWRTNNPNWYKGIQSAPPATVERENVLINA